MRLGQATWAFAFLFLTFRVASLTQAAPISIHFDQDVYIVHGPGETIDAKILIDGDLAASGDNPVPNGLFSIAVDLQFDGTKAQVSSVADVISPAELENFGFSSGAFRTVSMGTAAVKGNIDQNASPLVPYGGSQLATFKITNLASAPDSYPLDLDFFRTVGVNEDFFLDGVFSTLDADIAFRPARVLVVPEPATCALWVLGVMSCLHLFRRRKEA